MGVDGSLTIEAKPDGFLGVDETIVPSLDRRAKRRFSRPIRRSVQPALGRARWRRWEDVGARTSSTRPGSGALRCVSRGPRSASRIPQYNRSGTWERHC